MARKLVGGDTAGAVPPSLSRRAYVRMGAIAAAAVTGAASVPGGVVADEESGPYHTITLKRGEQRSHTIEDGETFEHVLIDQTATDAMFALSVAADAEDWTIRNVGWKGVAPTGSARKFTFLIHARGHGTIENVFIDQRAPGSVGSDVGGIWTFSDSHHGHIDCRHNFIAGCGNNASYPSGDGWGHRDASGTISHYRCYHRDNTVANFRPGMAGCRIVECVSVTNDPDGTRGPYPSTDSQLTRAIWAWHHPDIVVEDSSIWHDSNDIQPAVPFWATHRSGSPASAGTKCELTVRNCDINASWTDEYNLANPETPTGSVAVTIEDLGTDPTVEVLGDGVPTTPEMAAAGERELPPELGSAPGGGTAYTRDDVDPYDYARARGVHTTLPHELVIDHDEPGARVTYTVTIDGTVEAGEWASPARVIGGVAKGGVGPTRGLDNLYFDGEIVTIDLEHGDHATVYLADAQTREIVEELDPAAFDRPPAPDVVASRPDRPEPAGSVPDEPPQDPDPNPDPDRASDGFGLGMLAGAIGLGTSAYVDTIKRGRF